jgi:hypothetical protein
MYKVVNIFTNTRIQFVGTQAARCSRYLVKFRKINET